MDLAAIIKFKSLLSKFKAIEDSVFKAPNPGSMMRDTYVDLCILHERCFENFGEEYKTLRTKIAESIPNVRRIAYSVGIFTNRQSVGYNSTINVDLFNTILEDHGHIKTKHFSRFDALNKIIGSLRQARRYAFLNLFNPIHWLSCCLGLPLLILKAVGFDTDNEAYQIRYSIIKLVTFFLYLSIATYFGISSEHLASMAGKVIH